MKLSENTLAILKNFAQINSGIVLKTGNVQKTISPEMTILVEAEMEEAMPVNFGIYDLNQFLGNLSTLSDPDLTFSDDSVLMEKDGIKFNYYACSANLITAPPDKELAMKQIDVAFTLTHSNLQILLKLAAMNNLSNISVIGKNGEISLQTHEKANDTSNYANVKIADYTGEDFTASFKTDNLRLVSDDYDVEVQIGGFAKFTAKTKKLKYFIAMETK
jgi:hypothetical protein